jgi:VWFA-related protein
MRKFNRISPIILSFVALLFVSSSALTQTTDPLQVIKTETANSKRTWRWGAWIPVITTYEDFELNSCTLTFRTKTFPKNKKYINYPKTSYYPPQIYRYTFPLKSMDARLEWLDTYKSYVVSLSGLDSIITIETATPSIFFKNTVSGNKLPAPNVSIPFADEDSAKRVKMALQSAIAACGGSENPIQKVNLAGKSKEDFKPNDEDYKVKVNVDLVMTDVMVTGDNVPELRAEDLLIYDNGVAQRISNFSHDLPISIALVIEPQAALIGTSEWQIAAFSALRFLKPGDQVVLYSLNGDRLCNLTEDRIYIAKLISFLAGDQKYDNNIFGTLSDAALYLKQNASNRRVILLMSYGLPYPDPVGSGEYRFYIGPGELKRVAGKTRIELLESATTLDYATRDWVWSDESNRTIKNIAEDTGGEMFEIVPEIRKRMSMPTNALEQAVNRLRTQYTIRFTPSNPGESGSFHELTVRLANKDRCPTCKIKARRGYYAGVASSLPAPKQLQAKPVQSVSEIDNYLVQQIITTAASSYHDLDDISFAITNSRKTENPNGQSQMKLDLSINPAGIATKILDGRRAYRMQAAFFYNNKAGKSLGSNVWKIEGSVSEKADNRVTEKGIQFSAMIPIKAEDQILKIVLYDEISGRIASKFTKKKGKGLAIDPHPWYGLTSNYSLTPEKQ